MTQAKTSKRVLLFSALSLILCVAMLVGTTFAWFTDTASTGVNKIQAGKLDIALEMRDANGKWVSAEGKTLDFVKASGHENEEILWEPGCTYSLPELRIVNNGNLALKYKVAVTGIQGDAKLNEVIDWTIRIGSNEFSAETVKHLKAGESESFTISGSMKTNAGNAYQGLTIEKISITVSATQDTVEYDSTGNRYDSGAEYSTADVDKTAKLITGGTHVINEDLSISGETVDAIRVTGGDVTIIGGSYSSTGTGDNAALRVDGGTVTIKNGSFFVGGDNNCIYAAGGNIVIEGGEFKSEEKYAGHYWTLNVKDYSGSVITLKGGKYYGFNPLTENTAPAGTTEVVVADGYEVVQNGEWYYVVPEDATLVSNSDALSAAVANGGTVVLADDITVSGKLTLNHSLTLIGNGAEINYTGTDRLFNVQSVPEDVSIEFHGVVLNAPNAERGISFAANTKTVKVQMDACTVAAKYPVNVASSNTDIEVVVKNSTLNGYCAAQTWSANSVLTFENCNLIGVNKWDNTPENGYAVLVVNEPATGSQLSVKNCTLSSAEQGTADEAFLNVYSASSVTFEGCTFIENGKNVPVSDLVNHCCFFNGLIYSDVVTVK